MISRVQQLIEKMALSPDSALLVHNPSNMFYLAHYRGEGLLFISQNVLAVITDSRYTQQAKTEAKGFNIYTIDKNTSHGDIAYNLIKANNLSHIYFEDDYLSVQTFQGYQKQFEDVSFSSVENAITDLRQIKDEDEIAKIKAACAITTKAFDYILTQIDQGVSEKELALALDYFMVTNGASATAFSTIVASGENGALPHAIPGDRKITAGDMITFDFGAKVDGYCSDMTRTVAFGVPSDKMQEVYFTVLKAQELAEAALAPNRSCKEIDAIARDYIAEKGYGDYFGHGLGHSLGIDIHESPRLSYASNAVTQAGHLLTVEPGIYLPGIGGVRIENTCLVTETGSIPLTTAPKELIIL